MIFCRGQNTTFYEYSVVTHFMCIDCLLTNFNFKINKSSLRVFKLRFLTNWCIISAYFFFKNFTCTYFENYIYQCLTISWWVYMLFNSTFFHPNYQYVQIYMLQRKINCKNWQTCTSTKYTRNLLRNLIYEIIKHKLRLKHIK